MEAIDYQTILPEIVLLVAACLILLIDLGVSSHKRGLTYALSVIAMLGVGVMYACRLGDTEVHYAFTRMVQSDMLGNLLKAAACFASAVSLIYARDYAADRGMLHGGELFTLSLFALLGVCVMTSANNLLVVYLGLELLTLSSYALVALRRDSSVATEAAIKYFVLGAIASGFLLYGMSMIYGATGSLELGNILVQVQGDSSKVFVLGLVFLLAGIGFKFGAAPFHMWVPDVYHGAPTAITLMIGGAPKFAALAIALRLLVEGLLPAAVHWQQMLMVMAVASLILGNLAAIAQKNIKRMLAYSTIAQMGFVFLALLAGVDSAGKVNLDAYSSSVFYVLSYVLTTLLTFGVVLIMSRQGFESEEISDFAGLSDKSPFFAAMMAVGMFSLAGIPMFIGFPAKFTVLQALLNAGRADYLVLAVFAVMMSLVAAFYYIRIVKVMFFDQGTTASYVDASWITKTVLAVNGLLILYFGIFPQSLLALSHNAVVKSLGF